MPMPVMLCSSPSWIEWVLTVVSVSALPGAPGQNGSSLGSISPAGGCMFSFIKDGPEIPQEIFHALEDNRLVFFCGAGISQYTDLPDFKGLVEKLLHLLTAADKRKMADGAFKRGQYDRALDVVEKNTLPNVMRRELIKELSKPFSKKLDVHQAILDLARLQRGNGYRLVTTNVDRRFLEAVPPCSRFTAPSYSHDPRTARVNSREHGWVSSREH